MPKASSPTFYSTLKNSVAAGILPVVFGTQTPAAFCLSLPERNERGESRREGKLIKKRLLSPALSSFFQEERERKRGSTLKANLLPGGSMGRWRGKSATANRTPGGR